MNIRTASVFILLILMASCGYTAGESSIFTNVRLFPENEAVDQPLDVEVAAVFEGDKSGVTDWSVGFTLKKDDEGPNLCTGYTYDSMEYTTVCEHDPLDPASTYVTGLDGLPFGATGGATQWQTVSQ